MNEKILKAKINKQRDIKIHTFNDDDKVSNDINKSLEMIEKVLEERDELINGFIGQVKELIESSKPIDNSKDIIEAINNIKLSPKITVEKDEIKIPSPVVKIVNQDLYDTFKPSDSLYNDSTNINYHGFIDRSGRWFILREIDGDRASYRYATSDNNNVGYIDALKQVEKLDYLYYNEVTL